MSPGEPLDHLAFWQEADEHAMAQARDALYIIADIHEFDREEMAVLAAVLADPEHEEPRRDLEKQLSEETGIDVHLTPSQWGVISSELGGVTDDMEIS